MSCYSAFLRLIICFRWYKSSKIYWIINSNRNYFSTSQPTMEFRLASSKFQVHRWGGSYTYIYYIYNSSSTCLRNLCFVTHWYSVYVVKPAEKFSKKLFKKFVKWEIMSIFAAANERYNGSDALRRFLEKVFWKKFAKNLVVSKTCFIFAVAFPLKNGLAD